jgi:plastocyanin domain-containing protein
MKKSNSFIIIAILLTGLIIAGALFFSKKTSSSPSPKEKQREIVFEEIEKENVSVVDGKQIIELRAKGGFSPVHSLAKANLPTILRINTNGTFDCSSVLRIPKLNISENLPMSGSTDIEIGIQKTGILQGTCGMGMYPFDIKFE